MYDFPTAPVLDQEVTFPDSTSYVWNGAAWDRKGGGTTAGGGGGLDQATADGLYVNVPGDTMTGNLTMSGTAAVKMSDTSGLHWAGAGVGTGYLDFTRGICLAGYGSSYGYGFVPTLQTLNYNVPSNGQHSFYVGFLRRLNFNLSGGMLWGTIRLVDGPVILTESGELNGLIVEHTIPSPGPTSPSQRVLSAARQGVPTAVHWDLSLFDTGSEQGLAANLYAPGSTTPLPTFQTVFDPAYPGLYVSGDISALSHTTHVTSATVQDVKVPDPTTVQAAWAALQPKQFRKANPAQPKGGKPYPEQKLRYGFIADDLYENPASRCLVSTKSNRFGTVAAGTDIAQVLALAVARIKQLEGEVEKLKAWRR